MLVYREGNNLVWVSPQAPSHLVLRARRLIAAGKARPADRLGIGKVIPHVTQHEDVDFTYKQAQRGKRSPASEKAAWDFTQ